MTMAFWSVLMTNACSKKVDGAERDGGASAEASVAASSTSSAAVDAAPPTPRTPAELLQEHRDEMAKAAEDGQYATVCTGTPWVNATVCNWVAARASGKPVNHPDGELFHGYFVREHWKHVYGRILSDADSDGAYEVSVGGYTHHCMLDTDETKYSSKGAFNLWVQEQPEPREVTVNSGATQQWVVLEEATLAKMLLDLAKSNSGVEGTAMAKNAIALIAKYQSYAERKGELPTLPGMVTDAGPRPPASAAPSPPARAIPSAAPPSNTVSPHPSSLGGQPVPGSPPVSPVLPANDGAGVRVRQCCHAIRKQAKGLGSTPDGAALMNVAARCDMAVSQTASGQAPNFTPVRQMLRGRLLPAACAGM